MQEQNRYTICIYVRLSSEDDDLDDNMYKDESNSITTQREIIHSYIDSQPDLAGSRIIEKCDDGFSGTHFDNRPQFQEMMELAKSGEINCIIVKDFSRFGRDYIELGNYMEQLFPFLGIRFISVNDGYDSNNLSEGEIGGLDVSFRNLVYDYYARETSKKEKLAWKKGAERGEYHAATTLYGYKKSADDKFKLEIDPDAAQIVREVFSMRIAGMLYADIAANLNKREIPTPTEYKCMKGDTRKINNRGRKCYWSASVIATMLRNEKYAGNMVLLRTYTDRIAGKQKRRSKDEWVRVENTHEAIVSYEDFLLAQGEEEKTKCKAAWRQNIFVCGICGRKMRGMQGSRMMCGVNADTKGVVTCVDTSLTYPKAEKIIWTIIQNKINVFLDRDALTKDVSKLPILERKCEHIKSAMETAELSWKCLYNDYADRKISREVYSEKTAEYRQQKDNLEKELEKFEADIRNERLRQVQDKKINPILEAFSKESKLTEEMKKVLIDKVLVYPGDRFEIIWNFNMQKYFGNCEIAKEAK